MLLSDLLSHEMIQQQGKPRVGTETRCCMVRPVDTQFGCGWVAQLMPMHLPLPRPEPARHWAAMPPCLFQKRVTGMDEPTVSFVGTHRESRRGVWRDPRQVSKGSWPVWGRAMQSSALVSVPAPSFLWRLPISAPFPKCWHPGGRRSGRTHTTTGDATSPSGTRHVVCAHLCTKRFPMWPVQSSQAPREGEQGPCRAAVAPALGLEPMVHPNTSTEERPVTCTHSHP